MKKVYMATDSTIFDTEEECKNYEASMVTELFNVKLNESHFVNVSMWNGMIYVKQMPEDTYERLEDFINRTQYHDEAYVEEL